MSETPFKLTLHMVSSLDGMIASKDNNMSWFETTDKYDNGVNGQDIEAFLKTIDCYVMGSRTYEQALELSKNYGWAYGDTPTIVLSKRKLTIDRTSVKLFGGSINELVTDILLPNYKNVWLVGGPTIAAAFIKSKLVDEIRISILPIILGDGLPFFSHPIQQQSLHLLDCIAYKNGMIELCYEIKKDQ